MRWVSLRLVGDVAALGPDHLVEGVIAHQAIHHGPGDKGDEVSGELILGVPREAEEVLLGLGDLPLHGPFHRGGVQVASQHQGLVFLVPRGLEGFQSGLRFRTIGQAQSVLLDADLHDLVDHRQLEMQSGHGRGMVLAKPQDDRLLMRLDRVGRVEQQPEQEQQANCPWDERDEPLPGLAGRGPSRNPAGVFFIGFHASMPSERGGRARLPCPPGN